MLLRLGNMVQNMRDNIDEGVWFGFVAFCSFMGISTPIEGIAALSVALGLLAGATRLALNIREWRRK
jgi:hypothetical protein